MPSEIPAEVLRIEWLAPWQATTDEAFVAELRREVARGHPLFECPSLAIGRRVDCDDVLFWLPAGPAPFAVVHLTWSGVRERAPEWPSVQLFNSLAEWLEHGMRADQLDHGA